MRIRRLRLVWCCCWNVCSVITPTSFDQHRLALSPPSANALIPTVKKELREIIDEMLQLRASFRPSLARLQEKLSQSFEREVTVYYSMPDSSSRSPVTPPILGSIIAASAISPVDLQKRPFTKHPHLKRRFLDPQLAHGIDPSTPDL